MHYFNSPVIFTSPLRYRLSRVLSDIRRMDTQNKSKVRLALRPLRYDITGEIKLDVTWSYVKRQTAKMTSEFVFFSSNPSLNYIKIGKCLLLFATNTNIFTPLFKELKTDGKSFIFAVCRLTLDHVTSSLISLL